jgi:tetratricopeptide (TPR) repeat protein
MMKRVSSVLLVASLAALAPHADAADSKSRLTLVPGDREPEVADTAPASQIAGLRKAVEADPKDRKARFELVRALMRAKQLDEALAAARDWRASDAYNLVVVRLIGDLYSELGRRDEARRAYSAVVELLPQDAGAQRALASVLKQAGDLRGAYDRLRAAADLAAKDRRLAFELADVANRLGETAEARERFEAIVGDAETPEAVRYPAKQRLAQVYRQLAREADAAGKATDAAALEAAITELAIAGGTENDIKVYLTWDTDRSDVDLWVTNPAGERVFYSHKQGQFGDALYDDVTTGYGPESFTAPTARAGEYLVQVNYYSGGRSNFSEARGEVVIVLDEGKPTEHKQVLPYRLFEPGQTVSVARIQVGKSSKAGGK